MTIKTKMLENLKRQKCLDDEQLLDNKKMIASSWFGDLRDDICASFERIEKNQFNNNQNINFHKKKWERNGGGGGVISVMKGNVFEKVGVNISTVHGEFSEEFRSQIPGAEDNGKFWASGISVVSHMCNPYVPAAHMNTRLLVTGEGDKKKIWFGGGGDLTPIFEDEKASSLFHKNFKLSCEKYNTDYYPRFKHWCDEYFYLPHRKESRGIGGIFFDYLNTNNWENDLSFVKDIGKTFLSSYLEIINSRINNKFTKNDRKEQLIRRGRYVEFNLLYDRGTIFGLKTGGNTEAVLMSLPPKVSWI
ncbi:oxygen-dependent coproporphyrinogen oxidase [Pseudomonadota bacterium]|nr:oxygen-dependent coproporphyrinogen oxidase [Pseudomonadota bacterium]